MYWDGLQSVDTVHNKSNYYKMVITTNTIHPLSVFLIMWVQLSAYKFNLAALLTNLIRYKPDYWIENENNYCGDDDLNDLQGHIT